MKTGAWQGTCSAWLSGILVDLQRLMPKRSLMPKRLFSRTAKLFEALYRVGVSWPTVIALLAGIAFHAAPARLLLSALATPPIDGSFIPQNFLKAQLRRSHIELGNGAAGFVLVARTYHLESPLAARETPFTISIAGNSDLVVGALVSATTFSQLSATPILGRSLQPTDEMARHPVVVLSERLWRRRYAADPKLVGKSIKLSNKTYTVIGIMPASFWFPYRTDPVELWMPQRNSQGTNPAIT